MSGSGKLSYKLLECRSQLRLVPRSAGIADGEDILLSDGLSSVPDPVFEGGLWWTPERTLFLAVIDQFMRDVCSPAPLVRESALACTRPGTDTMLRFACDVVGIDFSALCRWVQRRQPGERYRTVRDRHVRRQRCLNELGCEHGGNQLEESVSRGAGEDRDHQGGM